MRFSLVAAMITTVLSWPTLAMGQAVPQIDPYRCRLVLPKSITEVIERAAPGFLPWEPSHLAPEMRPHHRCTAQQAPYAVVGDFNGDGRSDLTLEESLCGTAVRANADGRQRGD